MMSNELETLVEQRVTYTLQLNGQVYMIENVPARVNYVKILNRFINLGQLKVNHASTNVSIRIFRLIANGFVPALELIFE